MQTQPLWSTYNTSNRLLFLNVISNKKKIFKDNSISDEVFFEKYKALQEYNTRGVESPSVMRFLDDAKVKMVSNEMYRAPKFYCTFRFGAFMFIPFFLLKQDITPVLLVSKESHGNMMRVLEKNGYKNTFQVIIVNDANGFKKVIKHSKEDKSFFCVLDIGTSANERKESERNITTVSFNNMAIKAKIGIPYLSSYLNIPIVPIFAYRDITNTICFTLEKEFSVTQKQNRFTHANTVTHNLWMLFETYANAYPEQWESLSYVHDYYQMPSKNITVSTVNQNNAGKEYKFNSEKYSFIIRDNKFYLYDYDSLTTILVSEYIFLFLHKILESNYALTLEEIRSFFKIETTINLLLEKQILK